jgi:hypothetical protein
MTLYVLVAGVGLAILFDAAFNYLRRSLLVYRSRGAVNPAMASAASPGP